VQGAGRSGVAGRRTRGRPHATRDPAELRAVQCRGLLTPSDSLATRALPCQWVESRQEEAEVARGLTDLMAALESRPAFFQPLPGESEILCIHPPPDSQTSERVPTAGVRKPNVKGPSTLSTGERGDAVDHPPEQSTVEGT
jgi:hypothetical protein